MEKLFKDETYVVTSAAKNEATPQPSGSALVGYLKRAALKRGFQIASYGGYDKVAEVSVGENIKFESMQAVMDEVTATTGLALFLAAREDVLGTNLLTHPEELKKASFLRSGISAR